MISKLETFFPVKIDRNVQIAIGAVAGAAAAGFVFSKIKAQLRWSNGRQKWDNVGKDIVVLHMFSRPYDALNLSPYPAKLETFLRFNKIRYVSDFDFPMSSKNKSPWITINGIDVADSQLAIEYLCRHFNINMNAHLSKEEVAISRAMRALLEDHLYFALVVEKWVVGRGRCMLTQTPIPGGNFGIFFMKQMLNYYSKLLTTQAYMQGMGRHSFEDVRRMAKEDVRCIGDFLGDKKYLMGDQVSEVDCVVFGFMQIGRFAPISQDEDPLADHPNIKRYVERIKEEFYPDWNDLLPKRE